MVGVRNGSQVFEHAYPPHTAPTLTYDQVSGFVYESGSRGIGMVDPQTGQRIAWIRGFHAAVAGVEDDTTTVPALSERTMYVGTCQGAVVALRLPAVLAKGHYA